MGPTEQQSSDEEFANEASDLKRAYHEMEARFEAVVSRIDEGVLVVDDDGTIVLANDAAQFLLGRNHKELAGEDFGRPSVLDDVTELNTRAADGSVRFIEMRLIPTPWQDRPATLVTLKDVTEQHERAMQAEQEVRQRDDFIAMLSHELRNPLAAISGAATLLGNLAGKNNQAELAGNILQRQFSHLTDMLDDLLDTTRLGRGKLMIEPQAVCLRAQLEDVIRVARESGQLDTRDFCCQLPSSDVHVRWDPVRIQQALVNLLSNAVRYSEPGDRIQLESRIDGDRLIVTIHDSGQGIAPELMESIFNPFVQSNRDIDRGVAGGLGLGLSLARSLVELHGGSLTAHSDGTGGGSRFTMVLPGAVETPQDQTMSPSADDSPAKQILVVEDAPDIRCMLRMLLEQDGYQVHEVGDGRAGLERLRGTPPDFALVDIGLPEMNGYELAKHADRLPNRSRFRLIALTGYGRPEDREAALESGFDEHLVKPLDFQALTRILNDHSPSGRRGR